MKEVILKFYTPEKKPPASRRVKDKNSNIRDAMIFVLTTDGLIHAACYTDQVDGRYDFKVWHTKRPIKGVVMYAEKPEGILC